MLETFEAWDKALFLWLNSGHADWLDPIMWFITGKKEWLPFYAFLVIIIFKKYGWYGVAVLAGVGVTIALADQFASGFCKPFFERLRPSHAPELAAQVHTLHGYLGGKYGFISSHAANTFGMATFLHLTFRYRMAHSAGLFAWAALVSYSRIYVGVHYPGDIIGGALAGICVGTIVFAVFYKVMQRTSGQWLLFDRNL